MLLIQQCPSCGKNKPIVAHLKDIVCIGKDDGVDWTSLSNLDFIVKQINTAHDGSTLTNDPPSMILKDILTDAATVCIKSPPVCSLLTNFQVGQDILKEVK